METGQLVKNIKHVPLFHGFKDYLVAGKRVLHHVQREKQALTMLTAFSWGGEGGAVHHSADTRGTPPKET